MANWQTIEMFDVSDPIWVIKYDMYSNNHDWCSADDPGAVKYTDCHGWYKTQAEALKVMQHFPKPNSYRVEKVHYRYLKEPITGG